MNKAANLPFLSSLIYPFPVDVFPKSGPISVLWSLISVDESSQNRYEIVCVMLIWMLSNIHNVWCFFGISAIFYSLIFRVTKFPKSPDFSCCVNNPLPPTNIVCSHLGIHLIFFLSKVKLFSKLIFYLVPNHTSIFYWLQFIMKFVDNKKKHQCRF